LVSLPTSSPLGGRPFPRRGTAQPRSWTTGSTPCPTAHPLLHSPLKPGTVTRRPPPPRHISPRPHLPGPSPSPPFPPSVLSCCYSDGFGCSWPKRFTVPGGSRGTVSFLRFFLAHRGSFSAENRPGGPFHRYRNGPTLAFLCGLLHAGDGVAHEASADTPPTPPGKARHPAGGPDRGRLAQTWQTVRQVRYQRY